MVHEETRLHSRDQFKIDGLVAASSTIRGSLFQVDSVEWKNSIVSIRFFAYGIRYAMTGDSAGDDSHLVLEVQDDIGRVYQIPWWMIPDEVVAVFGDGQELPIALTCDQAGC